MNDLFAPTLETWTPFVNNGGRDDYGFVRLAPCDSQEDAINAIMAWAESRDIKLEPEWSPAETEKSGRYAFAGKFSNGYLAASIIHGEPEIYEPSFPLTVGAE